MANPEWFRNKTWSTDIAADFDVNLGRARRKEQYLRIQASTLAPNRPEIAHALLDRFFKLPDQFEAAQAHVDRATAYLAQGQVEHALLAYEHALIREEEFPRLKTEAYLELPFLVAIHGLRTRYVSARRLLDEHKGRLMFPVDHFKWNTSQALIASDLSEEARPYAKAALVASAADHSGFANHAKVGLVPVSFKEVSARLQAIRDA